jgi:hypothetical protein
MSIIVPSRRSFLLGVGATVIIAAETKAALIMPAKKIILPNPIEHVAIRNRAMRVGLVMDETGRPILQIGPGFLFEQSFPNFDFLAYAKASGLPLRIQTKDTVTQEVKISWFNGATPEDFKFPIHLRRWS